MILKADVCKCNRCDHVWLPRIDSPIRCASCKTPYWNNPSVQSTNETRTRTRDALRNRANSAVSSAIRKGKLIRPKVCPKCNSTMYIEAHHPDYTRPLEVEWMCRKCHKELTALARAESSLQNGLVRLDDLEAAGGNSSDIASVDGLGRLDEVD